MTSEKFENSELFNLIILTLADLEKDPETKKSFNIFCTYMQNSEAVFLPDTTENKFEAFKAIQILVTRKDFYNTDANFMNIRQLLENNLPRNYLLYIDHFIGYIREEKAKKHAYLLQQQSIAQEAMLQASGRSEPAKSDILAPPATKHEEKKIESRSFPNRKKIICASVLGMAGVFIVATAINKQVFELTNDPDNISPTSTAPFMNDEVDTLEASESTEPAAEAKPKIEAEKPETKPAQVEADIAPKPQLKKNPVEDATPRQKALAVILKDTLMQSVKMTLSKQGNKIVAGCPDFEADKLFGYPDGVFNQDGVYEGGSKSGSTAHCDYRFGGDPNGEIAVTLNCGAKPEKVKSSVKLNCTVSGK